MSVWVSGDIHGNIRRFSVSNFPEQGEMTKDDYIIILGDFGLIWSTDNKDDEYWLDWLNNKPFTTLFIDGNHENFDLLYTYPVVDFCGGKAHKIRDSVYHLIRGYVFNIDNKKFFAFGGASSHDVSDGILDPDSFDTTEEFKRVYKYYQTHKSMFRIKGVSWWEQELPTEEEMKRGEQSLSNENNEVDFVISHCAPQEISSLIGFTDSDKLTMYFNKILQNKLKFTRWLFGHYHINKQILGKFLCLYEQIIRIV